MTATSQRIGNDELERQVLHNIADSSWHAVNIIEDDGHPPWTFTIGLYETWGFPELIIIGHSRPTAWFYRKRHFPLYQILWPNNDGWYPWSPDAPETFKEWQSILGKAPIRIEDPYRGRARATANESANARSQRNADRRDRQQPGQAIALGSGYQGAAKPAAWRPPDGWVRRHGASQCYVVSYYSP